jgi:hypothetical protein
MTDKHAYSLVINTCAFSNADINAKREAFDIALTVMDELLDLYNHCPKSLNSDGLSRHVGAFVYLRKKRLIRLKGLFFSAAKLGL